MPVLIAIGIVSVLATMSLVSSMTAGMSNRKFIERLNRIEGFYSGELLAWHTAERVKAGLEVSGEPIPFTNNYAENLSGNSEGGDGVPYNIIETRRFSPTQNLIRRLDPGRFIASVSANAAACGKIGFKGDKKNFQVCLASSSASSVRPVLHLAYLGVDGGQGINIARILNDGTLDMTYGTDGISRVRGVFTVGSFAPLVYAPFVTRSDGSLLFTTSGGLLLVKPDGQVDSSYGSQGKALAPFKILENLVFEALDENDAYLVTQQIAKIQLFRTLRNGSTDVNFGVSGTFEYTPPINVTRVALIDILHRSTESILLFDFGILDGGKLIKVDTRLASVTNTGQLNSSFGEGGFASFSDLHIFKFIRLPEGKFLAAGRRVSKLAGGSVSGPDVLVQLLSNGSFDLNFGNGGVKELNSQSQVSTRYFFDPLNRLIIMNQNDTSSANNFIGKRYLTDGTLDSSFGNSGTVEIANFPSSNQNPTMFECLQFARDGSIFFHFYPLAVVYGAAPNKHFLIHLLTNGSRDSNFGTNGMSEIPGLWGGTTANAAHIGLIQ